MRKQTHPTNTPIAGQVANRIAILAVLAGGVFVLVSLIRAEMPIAAILSAAMMAILLGLIGVERTVEEERGHALFQSDQRFRQLADAMPQIVWTAEPDGKVDYGNRALAEYTALTPDSIEQQNWIENLHPDDIARTSAAWSEAVARGCAYDIEYRLFRLADRSYRWHHSRAVPIRNDDGRIVKWYGTATDIHDTKVASDKMACLAQQLATTLESIAEAFFTLDFDWHFTYLNKESERILGRSRDELLGKRVWDEYPDLVGTMVETEYRRAIEERRTVEFELMYRPLDRYLSVRAYPSPDGLTVYFADSTDRRRLELFKDEQTEILQQIAGGAPPADVLAATVRMLESQNDTLRCSIMLLSDAGSRFDRTLAPRLPALVDAFARLPLAALLGEGPGEEGAVRMSDIAHDPLWTTARQLLRGDGIAACWSYPLRSASGHLFGAFAVFTPTVRAPCAFEADMVESCALTASIALERERTERQARDSAAGLRLRQRAIEASANPIVIRRAEPPDFPVEYANPAFEHVTGFRNDEILGRSLSMLIHGDRSQPGLVELDAARVAQREAHVMIRGFHRDGAPLWFDIYSSPVRDEQGTVTHFVQAMYDVTAARQYQDELEYRSNHDLLTGLANRNLLRDRAGQAIARARSSGAQVWIAFLNLDRFRSVTETLGHDAGDAVLQATAGRIRDAMNPVSTASRWGSDEFVLVLSDVRGEHAATSVVGRIMEDIAQPLRINGASYFPACTAGLAMFPADGDDAAALIRNAQMAMRMAKDTGGRKLQFFTAAMNARARDRQTMEADLRHALERGELLLHYQPQVNLHTGRMVGMEALVRWNHPELGLVGPDRFISLAEDTGLIVPIGAWVMQTACENARRWRDAGFGNLCIGVNLSVIQFYQPDLIQSVRTILEETGLEPHYLDIELTEGLVMTDVDHALDVMHQLQQLGVQLSLDDFGTGYSSLSYLRRFPINVLKIDQSFVRNITTDPGEAAIARSIISLAHSLQLQVIAEGVETEEQLAFLRRHRCDQIQGYYFSRPVPAAEFEQLLADERSLPAPDLPTGHRQTLLIVDDEANIRTALFRLLRRDGYRILLAASAEEGLAMMALHEAQVVISDQRMPGMSGTEFFARIKHIHPTTIRIMLSGYTAVDSIIEATNSGAVFRFHTKPWDDEVMRASIAEAFRYHWVMHGAHDASAGGALAGAGAAQ